MLYYKDKQYNFIELFNEVNGTLVRSNILNNEKQETNHVPDMRSYPELIDIGIMGTCHASKNGFCQAAGVDCYQAAPLNVRPNMSLTDFKKIIDQCRGYVFQIALGGAGDPNKHQDFEEILRIASDNNIIPNLTTSGFNMSAQEVELIKKYCGAVAVSYYSKLEKNGQESNPITIEAVKRLVAAGCTTNIHYVLSRDSIDEAIFRLENCLFPKGINAVVFLLYKPVGLGKKEKMLSIHDSQYLELLKLIDKCKFPYAVGMDSCQAPALRQFCSSISSSVLEFCDAARFSMYIDCDMYAYPCSFGHDYLEYGVDLKKNSIRQAWRSSQFQLFRSRQKRMCEQCQSSECRGCGLDFKIDMCKNRV